MFRPGDVISYIDMCREEGVNLQRGMNFHLHGGHSVILMSVRAGAPYADRVEDDGRTLIYEGHDEPARKGGLEPKLLDQSEFYGGGSLTQNGLFLKAVYDHKNGGKSEPVKVYEKIHSGIWVYSGLFKLVDSWKETSNNRSVFKFKLELIESTEDAQVERNLPHDRIIPTSVKLEVWKRDKGRCVTCGATDNLHFDHIIPYSKGGSSLVAENIQLLCARHNLQKSDRIV